MDHYLVTTEAGFATMRAEADRQVQDTQQRSNWPDVIHGEEKGQMIDRAHPGAGELFQPVAPDATGSPHPAAAQRLPAPLDCDG